MRSAGDLETDINKSVACQRRPDFISLERPALDKNITMIFFLIIYLFPAALLASIFALQANAQESDDMGPAAFLWPPDRRWSATEDNTPPCGSSAGVTNRTKFPLSKGCLDHPATIY